MANYNFKNEAEVYIDAGAGKIRLDVTKDLSFSQTFTDNTYEQKTLHAPQNLHDASNITKQMQQILVLLFQQLRKQRWILFLIY